MRDKVGIDDAKLYLGFVDGLIFARPGSGALRDMYSPILETLNTGSAEAVREAFKELALKSPRRFSEPTYRKILGGREAIEEERQAGKERKLGAAALRVELGQAGQEREAAEDIIRIFGGYILEDLRPTESSSPFPHKLLAPLLFRSELGRLSCMVFTLKREVGEWRHSDRPYGLIPTSALFRETATFRYRRLEPASDDKMASLGYLEELDAFRNGHIITRRSY